MIIKYASHNYHHNKTVCHTSKSDNIIYPLIRIFSIWICTD